MKQQTFASMSYAHKKKQTRKEKFLSEMERCIPWPAFVDAIAPYYPTSGRRGGQPIGLEVMLRVYLPAAGRLDATVVWLIGLTDGGQSVPACSRQAKWNRCGVLPDWS